MIISASRRTDIPAYYSDWLINRIKAGFVLIRNPYDPQKVSRINLKPEDVDIIVFWTKNPGPMINKLPILDDMGYEYSFLITITPYGSDIEAELPPKGDLVETFKVLSGKIGRDRTVWRYDPILLGGGIDTGYHIENFSRMARELNGVTGRCIISFIDMYRKCERNLKELDVREPVFDEIRLLGKELALAAVSNGMDIQTCAEQTGLSEFGIGHGKCIDDVLLTKITCKKISSEKDSGQRAECMCVRSADIGMYNTCPANCRYCYANYSMEKVRENVGLHDDLSPLLTGRLTGKESITLRT
ncbi:MAG: DUF1848 domain-containing protein [Elusimicrobiota bacterium]